MRRSTLLLLALAALLVLAPMALLRAGTGTDDAALAVALQNDPGRQPVAAPLLEPSPAVESGLFALQALGGATGLGVAVSALRRRRRA